VNQLAAPLTSEEGRLGIGRAIAEGGVPIAHQIRIADTVLDVRGFIRTICSDHRAGGSVSPTRFSNVTLSMLKEIYELAGTRTSSHRDAIKC
jgi:hypothetical protein